MKEAVIQIHQVHHCRNLTTHLENNTQEAHQPISID